MTETEVAAMKKEIMDGVTATVTGLIKPLADNQKIFADTMAADIESRKTAAAVATTTATPATTAEKTKPLTGDDVNKIVADALKAAQASSQQTAARQQVLETKLKDLPVAYRNQLGSDPAKWATEEQQIRDQFKADFAAAGGKTPNVGGAAAAPAGGTPAAGTVDYSKFSPTQLISMGLKQSTPQGPGAVAAAALATPGEVATA